MYKFRIRFILKVICLTVFLVSLIFIPQYKYITYKFLENDHSDHKVVSWALDFSQYYSAALTLLKGENFYDTKLIYEIGASQGAFNASMDYLYPPLLLFFIVPFTFISFSLAKIIWLFLNQALIVVLILISLKLIFRTKNKNIFWWSLGLFGVFQPLLLELRHGQADLLVALFLYLGIYFILLQPRKVGIVLYAVACFLKLSPSIFIFYFLKKRLFKIVLLVILVGIVILSSNLLLIEKDILDYYFLKKLPGLTSGEVFLNLTYGDSEEGYIRGNQALGSLVEKAFLLKGGVEGYRNNLLKIKIISLSLRFLVLFAILLLFKKNSRKKSLLVWEFCIFVNTVLLLNTATFSYHLSILILPLSGVLLFLVEEYKKISISFYILFAISFSLMSFTPVFFNFPSNSVLLFLDSARFCGLGIFQYLLFKIYRQKALTVE